MDAKRDKVCNDDSSKDAPWKFTLKNTSRKSKHFLKSISQSRVVSEISEIFNFASYFPFKILDPATPAEFPVAVAMDTYGTRTTYLLLQLMALARSHA